ncbi:MAG: 50S ribosomal protein L22 [Oscillospiraceae bacterium]|jgi:ribosomal protein L22, bacterial type|nr:50S ribosomal protein L22 [Oscillospiraceae bacterium]MBQ4000001.1 50S ribosomal protein L22 [Oscillospiraceae bacterium]MBQ5412483.1 50S ribosomal protein L22 [Oscillospiraceae bacterium]
MEAKAYLNNIRIAPRKVQIVLDLIRGKDLKRAQAILKYTTKAAAEPLLKLVNSAAANAENNFGMNTDSLYVSECFVCQGPTLKRIRPRAQGRAYRINKKTSHVTVVLSEREA